MRKFDAVKFNEISVGKMVKNQKIYYSIFKRWKLEGSEKPILPIEIEKFPFLWLNGDLQERYKSIVFLAPEMRY